MPIGPNLGYKLFSTGAVLTASQVQHNMANQSIMFYASAATRNADTALTAALTEGMFCYLADTDGFEFYNGAAWIPIVSGGGDLTAITAGAGITVTNGTGPVPTIALSTGATLTSPKETITTVATAPPAAVQVDVLTSSVLNYTVDATADWTINVRGNVSTTLNSLMAVGEQISVVFETPIGATAYEPTAFTIDGSAPSSIKYLGGTAPVGNINSTDVYVYTIRKTAATPTFTVLGAQNKFA